MCVLHSVREILTGKISVYLRWQSVKAAFFKLPCECSWKGLHSVLLYCQPFHYFPVFYCRHECTYTLYSLHFFCALLTYFYPFFKQRSSTSINQYNRVFFTCRDDVAALTETPLQIVQKFGTSIIQDFAVRVRAANQLVWRLYGTLLNKSPSKCIAYRLCFKCSFRP